MRLRMEQSGFTIIEVIILIVVITIGLLGSAELLKGVNIANKKARQKLLANQAAQKKIESLRDTAYPSITVGTFSFSVNPSPVGNGSATGSYTICEGKTACGDSNMTVESGIKKATVTVAWTDKTVQEIKLVTYITDNGIDRK